MDRVSKTCWAVLMAIKTQHIFSSVAEALSWADPGQGFQNLLGSAYGRRLFGEFLRY